MKKVRRCSFLYYDFDFTFPQTSNDGVLVRDKTLQESYYEKNTQDGMVYKDCH